MVLSWEASNKEVKLFACMFKIKVGPFLEAFSACTSKIHCIVHLILSLYGPKYKRFGHLEAYDLGPLEKGPPTSF